MAGESAFTKAVCPLPLTSFGGPLPIPPETWRRSIRISNESS